MSVKILVFPFFRPPRAFLFAALGNGRIISGEIMGVGVGLFKGTLILLVDAWLMLSVLRDANILKRMPINKTVEPSSQYVGILQMWDF